MHIERAHDIAGPVGGRSVAARDGMELSLLVPEL
jgi:hypothetical protein